MDDPRVYRDWADKCIEMANATADTKAQSLLFEMARAWLNVADELDRGTTASSPKA
jgi:hypothetical protein